MMWEVVYFMKFSTFLTKLNCLTKILDVQNNNTKWTPYICVMVLYIQINFTSPKDEDKTFWGYVQQNVMWCV